MDEPDLPDIPIIPDLDEETKNFIEINLKMLCQNWKKRKFSQPAGELIATHLAAINETVIVPLGENIPIEPKRKSAKERKKDEIKNKLNEAVNKNMNDLDIDINQLSGLYYNITNNIKEIMENESVFNEYHNKVNNYETAGNCAFLFPVFVKGKLISLVLQNKGLEFAKNKFNLSKAQLYKYKKATSVFELYHMIIITSIDFTTIAEYGEFIKEHIQANECLLNFYLLNLNDFNINMNIRAK